MMPKIVPFAAALALLCGSCAGAADIAVTGTGGQWPQADRLQALAGWANEAVRLCVVFEFVLAVETSLD